MEKNPATPATSRAGVEARALPWAALARSAILLLGLAVIGFAWTRFAGNLSPSALAPLIAGRGAVASVLFVVVAGAALAVGAPRQAIAFAAGYFFGLWWGFALGLAASLLSAVADFAWARFIGRAAVKRRLAGRLAKVDQFVAANPFNATLMLRLLPVGNNVLLNCLAGVSGVGAAPFLLASAIGYAPQTLIFALLGSGIRLDRGLELAIAIGLFVASGAVGMLLWRRQAGGTWQLGAGALSEAAASRSDIADDPS